MKNNLPLSLVFGLAVTSVAYASDVPSPAPKQLEPGVPRTVSVSESAPPPVVRAGLLQSTLILLPAEEKVANVFAGDTADWVFDGGHVASRFVSIKPKVASCATDVHIVSDHGNEYTIELREISGDDDRHFDSKVFLAPADKAAKQKLVELPVFVPASDLDRAKKEAEAAKATADAERKAEEAKNEQYRSQYPGTLHFDYAWNRAKGQGLGLQEIWRDDKFTYLRGQFQETPALYEVKDKRPSLINFDFSNGLYTVPKQLNRGYLSIGKQKVEFRRTGEGK